ncbi:TnsA endonuclease C-terminal domain-containing protein [Caballeronia sp. J97]|uniref:TnsA endonuclease C-terminal domain-containing protein n=1 Tax=Caballeronia sp. J97 TaxID=2805429 RepID=UPI002AAF50BC|nr:TnsA endonuclease C-terminal domain-containing protein [Caballeronia sp. J97]
MTSRTLEMRRLTIARKLREVEAGNQEGRHTRWISTRDMPGSGIKTRLTSMKTHLREVHLNSSAEHAAFLELWWDQSVLTVFEQVMIPTQESRPAALEVSVDHPTYTVGGDPVILSTDLVAVIERDGKVSKTAHSVKSAKAYRRRGPSPRQKIEQRYWERQGHKFKIVIANGMHASRSKNLAWLLRCENDMADRTLTEEEGAAQRELVRRLRKRLDVVVLEACRKVDKALSLPPGSGARAFRQLATTRKIRFDLDAIDPIRLSVEEIAVKI